MEFDYLTILNGGKYIYIYEYIHMKMKCENDYKIDRTMGFSNCHISILEGIQIPWVQSPG